MIRLFAYLTSKNQNIQFLRWIFNLQNIAEIVPDKYSRPTFSMVALKLSKTTKTVVQICARTLANLIIQVGVQEEARM